MTSADEAIRLGQELGHCILQKRLWLRTVVILTPFFCGSIWYGNRWLISFLATLIIGSIFFAYHYAYRGKHLVAEIQRKGPVR
jgi:hypothetical protein